jgi:hypothetical protein
MSEENQGRSGGTQELAKRPDESMADYVTRRRAVRERWELDRLRAEEARKHRAVSANDAPTTPPPVEDEDDDDRDEGPTASPPDALATEKAEREQRWAENRQKNAQEDELTRHWEEARVAHIDACGGLAPLTRDLPPMDTGRFPLPRVPAEDRAPRLERPDAPPQDAETELTAIIAECRHFMRAMAFESARMTPDAGDRMGFIERACRLAETGATVGDTVARVRGIEVPVLAPARRR